MSEQIVLKDMEKEMLSLMRYHIKQIELNAKAGKKEIDDDQRIAMLNDLPDIVKNHAAARKRHEALVANDKTALLKRRQQADCPTCRKTRKVMITGQARNELFGWHLDVVKCTTCKKKFTNPMPNNWTDMLAFAENLYGKLFSEEADSKAVLQELNASEPVDEEQSLRDLAAFKKAHLAAEAALAKSAAAKLLADESFERIYDMLLLAKVNQQNLNRGGTYLA